MSNYTTIVFRMPSDAAGKASMQQALELLEPHRTAMSLEDEMSTLEAIEQHPDFDASIAEEARRQVAELHKRAEAAAYSPITGHARATESVRGELDFAGSTDAQEDVHLTMPTEPETPLPRHIMFAADAISKNNF